jgi:hypothetical protein
VLGASHVSASGGSGRLVLVSGEAGIGKTSLVRRFCKELAGGATVLLGACDPLANKQGYGVITQMIPDMGWHFMNPKITAFDVTKPPILVYGKRGSTWQLVAFEWVFPKKPTKPPLPGATNGSFGAACHYEDGTFVFQASLDACAAKSPQSGAAFGFWHPDLVTLHVWAWYPNPDGVFSGMNPLMHPFNKG